MTRRPREGTKTEFAQRKDESKQNRRYDRESARSALCRTFFVAMQIEEAPAARPLIIRNGGFSMYEQTFSYEAHGQTLVIHLPKELDHHNCRNLKYETDLLLSENYISKVVFDFSRTEFMDSSGIGILLNRYKQMAGSGGTVTIYGVNAQVGRVLAIGGIGRLMKYFDTKEAAIAG